MFRYFVLCIMTCTALFIQSTCVFIENHTKYTLFCLSKKHNSNHARKYTIHPGQRKKILILNRIKPDSKDEEHEYITPLYISANREEICQLRQKICGTERNSLCWGSAATELFQGISSKNSDICWFNDRLWHEYSFQRRKKKYIVKYRAQFTGKADNIEYIIYPDESV